MSDNSTVFVDIASLRIGMFVYLDLGWMSHPFPSSSFKIGSEKQIETIRSLGLRQVRFSAERSDPAAGLMQGAERSASSAAPSPQAAVDVTAPDDSQSRRLLRERVAQQNSRFSRCEEQFDRTSVACMQVMSCVGTQPELARSQGQKLVAELVDSMTGDGESMIHLLSDGSGERAALHPMNVTVIGLLLGKALGLDPQQMQTLGLAALLHDVGKVQLPERVRWREAGLSAMEDKIHQEHVPMSVTLAQRMGLPVPVLQGIAQHHEMVDGSGFPLGIKGDAITLPARILALVNRYDNLCNPPNPNLAVTPHEALALIFAQSKTSFDATSLNAFIRLMGVYPPGSVVQLVDDRYALVMTVNSARPLRPQVIVHDSAIPKDEALILNLEEQPKLGIRRSLKPVHLPQAALSYLSPRKRISYFFEQIHSRPQACAAA